MKKSQSSGTRKPAAVQSIFRAANILACIGKQIYTITEIASACNLSNSTVHRILQALEDSRMVIKDPINRKYYLGDLVISLAMDIMVPHEYLMALVKEHMNRLADETEETVSLAVLVGQAYNALSEIPSKHKFRLVEARTNVVDFLAPFSASAMVLLSQLDEKELEARVRNLELTTRIEDRKRYLGHIKNIRKRGYAITHDDVAEGSMSISAPIFNYLLPTALNVYGPRDRMKSKSKQDIGLLRDCAFQISQSLASTVKARAPHDFPV
jgi:DNA-binding IclR family transcriptional regulator